MQINSACDRIFRAKNKLSTSISNNYNSLHSRIQIRFHENQMKSQAMSTLTFCSSYSKVKTNKVLTDERNLKIKLYIHLIENNSIIPKGR